MRAGDQPVPDWIVTDVMQKPFEIFLNLDGVFPKTPMPNVTFPVLTP
jgi:hypothetical protein